ncbi:ubiquitin domain-containing protein DSK2b-like [Vigna umbellata]|uniref:ubiquitin domain-containing protein DSK2b-like n=1 Tax=Vigna umbellata TaxID=87088 RepID=UPI001F5E5841|nr:ubiquitin domain-containing protein DSK2b-like [Vigna umbellata]
MREMMRNTDRAMSNIESSPEGFNMLRRMYENVQEPFLNATTMAGNAGNDGAAARNQSTNPSTANSEATSPVPNTNPLPNPWSSTGTGGGQNNTRRSTPAGGDARQQAPAGLGGLGLPDLEGMLGGMPDAAMLTQLMQNQPQILYPQFLIQPNLKMRTLTPRKHANNCVLTPHQRQLPHHQSTNSVSFYGDKIGYYA